MNISYPSCTVPFHPAFARICAGLATCNIHLPKMMTRLLAPISSLYTDFSASRPWSFQSSSGAVCSVDGATIAGASGIIPEKNLRTVFGPQIFLNTVSSLLSQPRPDLIHQLFWLCYLDHGTKGQDSDQKVCFISPVIPQMKAVVLLILRLEHFRPILLFFPEFH